MADERHAHRQHLRVCVAACRSSCCMLHSCLLHHYLTRDTGWSLKDPCSSTILTRWKYPTLRLHPMPFPPSRYICIPTCLGNAETSLGVVGTWCNAHTFIEPSALQDCCCCYFLSMSAAATLIQSLLLLQDLLTRHKAMVAGYLSRNYDQASQAANHLTQTKQRAICCFADCVYNDRLIWSNLNRGIAHALYFPVYRPGI